MSRTNRPGHYLTPIKSDGTPAVPAGRRGFYTLTAATYYVEVNMQSAPVGSLHLQSNAALIGSATLESTDADEQDAPVTYATDDGTWVQQNPSTAYVPTDGTGYSVSSLTITIAGGGSGGGCEISLADVGPCRLRLALVISTGGTFRVAHSGKA
jgi:hypothetical protein